MAEVDLTGFDGRELPEASRGAVFSLVAPTAGTYRVAVGDPMWIDLLDDDSRARIREPTPMVQSAPASPRSSISRLEPGKYRLELSAAEVPPAPSMVLGPVGLIGLTCLHHSGGPHRNARPQITADVRRGDRDGPGQGRFARRDRGGRLDLRRRAQDGDELPPRLAAGRRDEPLLRRAAGRNPSRRRAAGGRQRSPKRASKFAKPIARWSVWPSRARTAWRSTR